MEESTMRPISTARRAAVFALVAALAALAAGIAHPARPAPDAQRIIADLQAVTISTLLRTLRHETDDLPLDAQTRARSLVQLLTALQRVQPDRPAPDGHVPCAEVSKSVDSLLGALQGAQWRRNSDALRTGMTQAADRYKAAVAPLAQLTDPLEQASCLAKALCVLTGSLDDLGSLHASSGR